LSLSPNEIRKRAITFSHDWKDATDEKAESQTFWNEFFSIFGIERKRVATFEKRVDKLGGNRGYIDVFWPGFINRVKYWYDYIENNDVNAPGAKSEIYMTHKNEAYTTHNN
jgi:hypothetical protein